MATLSAHRRGVKCLELEKGLLFSGSYDNTIRVWDMKSNKCLRILSDHSGAVLSLHAYEDRLLSGSADQTIKVSCMQLYSAS